jgi:hypothetical protein
MELEKGLIQEMLKNKKFSEILEKAIKKVNVNKITKAIEDSLEDLFYMEDLLEEIRERIWDDLCDKMENDLRSKLSLPLLKIKGKK